LLGAVAYDVFRLPFVFAKEWGLDSVLPPLQLFKVFPRFGAMILGEPSEQPRYSLAAQLIGWTYHFSTQKQSARVRVTGRGRQTA